MAALLIGYARVSTDQQDVTASEGACDGLAWIRRGSTSTTGSPAPTGSGPGLREALAACRDGDTLVVTKLDRLARSLPDARAIAEDLTLRRVTLSLGGAVYDPNDPVGRLLYNALALVAEFESDLIRVRTCEGMKIAKAKGHLRGKQPKLKPRQEAHLVSLHESGQYSTAELADPAAGASVEEPRPQEVPHRRGIELRMELLNAPASDDWTAVASWRAAPAPAPASLSRNGRC